MNTKAKGTERQYAYSSAAEGGAGQTQNAARDTDETAATDAATDAHLRRILSEVQNTRKVGNAALQELESRLNSMGRPDPLPFDDSEPAASTRAPRPDMRAGGNSLTQGSMSEMGRYDDGLSLTERLRELSGYLHDSLAEREAARQTAAQRAARQSTSERQQPQYRQPHMQQQSQQQPQSQQYFQPKLTPTAPVLDRLWFEERFAALRIAISDVAERVPTKRMDALEMQFHQLMERLDAREAAQGGMGAVEAGLKKLAAYLDDSKKWAAHHDRRQRNVEERLDQLSGLVAQSHAAISATAKGLEIVARGTGPQLARQTADLVAARVEEKVTQLYPAGKLDGLSRELANLTTQQRQYARATDQRLKELQNFLENAEPDRQTPGIEAELEARVAQVKVQNQQAQSRPQMQPVGERKATPSAVNPAKTTSEPYPPARSQDLDEGDDYDRDLIAAAQRAARLAEGPRRDVPAHGEPVRYQIPYGEFLPDEERRNSHVGLVVAAVILLLASAAMLYLNLREKDVFGWMPSVSNPSGSIQDKGGRTSANSPVPVPVPTPPTSSDNSTAAIRRVPVSAAPSDENAAKPVVSADKDKTQGGTLTATDAAVPFAARTQQITVAAIQVEKNSLREAAVKGEPNAQFTVGQNLLSGHDTEQQLDTRERLSMAARWFRRAAEKGHPGSQYRLATLFELGQGAPKDYLMAEAWYRRAAEAGHVKAMHNLAVLAVGMRGGSANYLTAAKWFTKAAEHGLTDSQYNLGILYERGLGVTASQVKAYQWYSIAARFGDDKAAQKRDAVARKLSPQDKVAVETAVAGWTPQPRDPKVNGAPMEPPAAVVQEPVRSAAKQEAPKSEPVKPEPVKPESPVRKRRSSRKLPARS